MPAENRIGAGIPGRPFRGYRRHCPCPGAGRSARPAPGGVGGAVYGLIFAGCAPPGISPREPPLLRGSPLEGAIRFSSAGRGVPLPGPHPQVIASRSGAWADAGEEQDRGRLPGRPFRGYHLHCPCPGAGRSAKCGRGGDRKAVSRFAFPGLRPFRVLTTRAPVPARGPRGRASMVFVDGEGVPSPTPPRVISPRSGAWGDASREQDRGRHSRHAFPGISPALPPPPGRGRSAKRGRGGGI